MSNVGGIVKVEVDTSALAGTNLTALTSGLTFSVEQDYGAVFEINASGQIEVTNDGSGNGSQHILKCNYVPPVDNYQVYSNHPAGSTVNGRTSLATVLYKDAVNGYDTVAFAGNSNAWRQIRLDSSGNNAVLGFSVSSTNPETTEADLLFEVLASGKFTATVGQAQLSGANNIPSIVTNGSKFIGLGVYGNSVGCYLGSFGVKWRQILAVDNRWSNNGDSITVSVQGVGASGAIVTLNSERDGSGTSVVQTVTNQTDSSITYTVIQGALTSGEVYLFIDSNGNKTTNGFEINVGLSQPGTSGFLVENLVSRGAVTTNLSQMGTNTSGIIEFGNGRIGIVDNGNAEVHEYASADLSTRLRVITLGGLNTTENDSEDGCWMGNGVFGIVCEDNSNYIIHVFDYPDIALGSVTVPAKETHTVAVPGGDNNSGGEMLSYNPKTRTWYLGGEGEQANTLQKFYKIIRPLSEHTNFDYNDAELVVTEPFDAELLVGDLSGGFFHEASGTVVLCSHTASNLKQLDPEGDGTVISTKALSPTGNQWEAAVNLGGGDDVQAISEGNVTERFDYPAVASPIDLDGSAQSSTSASGDLTTEIPLSGDAGSSNSASGALETNINLAGNADSQNIASGDLDTRIDLAGDATAESVANANLDSEITLSGSAESSSSADGQLETNINLSGDASSQSGASGVLDSDSSLQGDAASSSTANADLITEITLVAAALSSSTANGTLSSNINLSGIASSISIADGVLTTNINLSGSALSEAIASAGLASEIILDGNAQSQSSASGELSGSTSLAGDAVSSSIGSGELTVEITLAGDAISESLASADLTAGSASTMSGQAFSQSIASGDLVTNIQLAGDAIALSTSSAGLESSIQLSGVAASISVATGDLVLSITLAGDALSQMQVDGTLSTSISFSGSAISQSIAEAVFALTQVAQATNVIGVAKFYSHLTGIVSFTAEQPIGVTNFDI